MRPEATSSVWEVYIDSSLCADEKVMNHGTNPIMPMKPDNLKEHYSHNSSIIITFKT